MNFTAGVSFDFGNKVKRIGLRLSFSYEYNFIQINSTVNAYYVFSSLALENKTPELQFGIGPGFGFGKIDSVQNRFVGLSENNLYFNNMIGYAYTIYLDKQETSQSSGLIYANFGSLSVITENDLLGGGKGWKDRFRTGAFRMEYQYFDAKIAINTILWTGDFSECTKVTDSEYPARFGYFSNDKAIHGAYSAGLFSLHMEQILPYGQVAKFDLGVDSEQVRHYVQNKALHDMPFYTDKMVKRKLMHIPMLQKDGTQYLFLDQQKIRPSKVYFNLGLNSGIFY